MDIDLSNLGNYYSRIANQSVGNGKNISNLTDGKLNGKSDDELMDVCKSFEAYFLEQVFKQMESTTSLFGEEGADNTMLTEYFGDMTIAKISENAAETQSLGLAQMLYEQMKRNLNPVTAEEAKAAAEAKAAETGMDVKDIVHTGREVNGVTTDGIKSEGTAGM